MKNAKVCECAGDLNACIESSATTTAFDEIVLDFLGALAKRILANASNRVYPDLITFGFFCRRKNILSLKKGMQGFRSGRGLLFHIAPSNVAMNFAYSLVSGLVTGNRNVVKISSTEFPQVEILNSLISQLIIDEFQELKEFISVVRYNNEKSITDELSDRCDARIIWGGNETINRIRESKLRAHANEVVFYNRHSFLIMDASSVVVKDIDLVAKAFFIDTFLNDQAACTAPKAIFWLGVSSEVEKARHLFWSGVKKRVQVSHEYDEGSTYRKFHHYCSTIASAGYKNVRHNSSDFYIFNNLMSIEDISESMFFDSGFFLEARLESITELSAYLAGRAYKPQTLTYYGFTDVERLVWEYGLHHYFDRVVPMGRSMDFSFTWDGYSLIHSLSRETAVVS